MQRFSKLATCPTRALCTRVSHCGIHTSESGEPSITLLEHRAALKKVRTEWLGRCQEQRVILTKVKKECEEKAVLLKELKEENAMLLKQREKKATSLELCQEQMALSFKRFEIQKAELLAKFQQEKAALHTLYEERKDKSSKDSEGVGGLIEKWDDEERQRYQGRLDQKREENLELFKTSLREKEARQKLEEILHIRAALEFIVYKARENGIIQVSPEVETQEGLDKLAQTAEFTTILQQEARARGLDYVIIMNHFHLIYYELSKPLEFQGRPITVRYMDFTDYERAVIVILLKVQSNWRNPMKWTEEKSWIERK